MRVPTNCFLLLLLNLPLTGFGQAPKSFDCDVVSLPQKGDGSFDRIQLGCGTKAALLSAAPQIVQAANWRIYYRGFSVPVLSAAIVQPITRESVDLRFNPQTPGLPDLSSLKSREITVIYAPPGQSTLVVSNSRGVAFGGGHATAGGHTLALPTFTKDKKSADIDLTGSLQTAVGASPQYFWSAKAAYPIALFRKYGTIAPTFDGQASQEPNADPDSMKASAVYKKVIAPLGVRYGFIVDGALPGYEFERKAKEEAVLVNGAAVKQKYQKKNTNLLGSGTFHYVTGLQRVNVTLKAGGELGKALSRSVRRTGTTTDSDLQIRRAVLGADAYTNIPWSGKPRINFDGHYTLRLPFTAEPFTQAHVNNGNEFLTSKARHYVNLNGNIPLTDGVAITVQYKYGSLPPTFVFLDHQVTLGFELLLKNH